MPQLTVRKLYSRGSALTEAYLDAMKSDIETFLNDTLLGADNINISDLANNMTSANSKTMMDAVGFGNLTSNTNAVDDTIDSTATTICSLTVPASGTYLISYNLGVFGTDTESSLQANSGLSYRVTIAGSSGGTYYTQQFGDPDFVSVLLPESWSEFRTSFFNITGGEDNYRVRQIQSHIFVADLTNAETLTLKVAEYNTTTDVRTEQTITAKANSNLQIWRLK